MCRAEKAIARGKEILTLISDIPEEGQDFAYSVEEKVIGIVSWIEENGVVTEKQETALDNIEAGISKWLN